MRENIICSCCKKKSVNHSDVIVDLYEVFTCFIFEKPPSRRIRYHQAHLNPQSYYKILKLISYSIVFCKRVAITKLKRLRFLCRFVKLGYQCLDAKSFGQKSRVNVISAILLKFSYCC